METFTVSVVSSTSFVGFTLGYALQDYNVMRNVIFAGILASMVVTFPSWPFLKRNPIEWREIDDEHPSAKAVGGGGRGGEERQERGTF